MTPGKFLRLLWPSEGFYCIAHPFKPKDSDVTVYLHKVFGTISEAVTHVHEMQHVSDTYFAVLTLEQERVWLDSKRDYKTGQLGAWAVRTQANSHSGKAVFFDLDVGSGDEKYPTQRDALAALLLFIQTAKLPMPTLVSSGGGVHVYWHFDTAVRASDWRVIAHHMRQLADALGLRVDPKRTTDSASVLRVPDTFNWKDRSNPRPVKVLQEGAVTPLDQFRRLVADAMISAGVVPEDPKQPVAYTAPVEGALPQQSFNDFGPPPTVEELGKVCAQVREIIGSQVNPQHPHYGKLDQPAWYQGMISTLRHAEGGEDLCRKLTALFPRNQSNVEAKLEQSSRYPPAQCKRLQEVMPWKDAPCQTCRFRNDPSVPNPFAATRKGLAAPPPMASLERASSIETPSSGGTPSATSSVPPPPPPFLSGIVPSLALQAAMIPNPPKPWERLKGGGISLTRTDKDGNESVSVIYEHDLYPLKRLVNKVEGCEQQLWRVTLPRVGAKEFVIDADVLYDSRKFAAAMSHNGIYPHKADLPALQDYMVAYISKLQKEIDADSQSTHLGWAEDYQQFILPEKTLIADGTVRASSLTKAAERAVQHIAKKGTLAKQVELLRFYEHPAYIPNQFAILGSLASIILYATGHHGVVINLSGEAGASKSTTLYTAASLWGVPKLWPINGTQRGATANARSQRIMTNANLPTCVDEITHLKPHEAVDMVMNITQPGHRLRLMTDGAERQTPDNYKSAIMIATANSSLHSLLSTDNAAGTAGSMRVFEIKMLAQNVHTKAQADEFLRELEQNYGHVGEVFANFVVRHRELIEKRVQHWVRVVDERCSIISAERFWSAVIAPVIVAAEICDHLRLMKYPEQAILEWIERVQIPYMRGVVSEEYRNPVAILTDYIAEKQGNIVIVDKATTIGANTSGQHVASDTAFAINTPHGALLGHYDIKTGILVLLKQGFKEHCMKLGTSASRILEELSAPRAVGGGTPRKIVVDRNARRTLGAGTPLAKGQTYCFVVDMKHPEIAGLQPVLVASNDDPQAKAAQA